jgi:HD-GYP domain-containing protein (c-di-GMP phosphodiesterase class II)
MPGSFGSELVWGATTEVRLSEVLGGLSYALDLTEGQREGHSVRSCVVGMKLAEIIGVPEADRSALFYALLMKDLGCSSNAARFAALFGADDHDLKTNLKTVNWSQALESFRWVSRNVAPGQFWLKRVWQFMGVMAQGPKGARDVVLTRCERGADIARMLGFADDTVQAIRALDEHWDGHGQPYGLRGEQISVFARILGLSQTFEVFFSSHGLNAAFAMAAERRGSWFEPTLVDALFSIRNDSDFWQALGRGDAFRAVRLLEPPDRAIIADDDRLNIVAEAFAQVIDAKSPWTYRHSNGVAELSLAIAERLDMSASEIRGLRRAALMHDLGKLGVSNLILDKPGKLTDEEFARVRLHPKFTNQILGRVGCFRSMSSIASQHHERLDGGGYHLGLAMEDLSLSARVICTADVCDALRASRPYRPGLPTHRLLEIMEREAGRGIDMDCFEAMKDVLIDQAVAEHADVPAVRVVPALSEDYHQAA